MFRAKAATFMLTRGSIVYIRWSQIKGPGRIPFKILPAKLLTTARSLLINNQICICVRHYCYLSIKVSYVFCRCEVGERGKAQAYLWPSEGKDSALWLKQATQVLPQEMQWSDPSSINCPSDIVGYSSHNPSSIYPMAMLASHYPQ